MRISVIVPALQEEAAIVRCLDSLRVQQPHEVIVVDGGSRDRTRDLAASRCDRLVHGPRGRAKQMNLGVAHASGDILLFIHADCHLEAGALDEARGLLRSPGVVAGCFQMRVTEEHPLYRSIDGCASVRVRWTGLIYGDQGLFVTRQTFNAVGGFPELRLMEDVFISRELRKHGRIVVGRKRIWVSPRRWQKMGIVRQTLRNWTLTALAGVGVHPDSLARYYPAVR